jgi:hypothetical protein
VTHPADIQRRRAILLGLSLAPVAGWSAELDKTRRIGAAVVGQSNEQGAGKTPDKAIRATAPLHDPIGPNGGPRSWWPYVASALEESKDTLLLLKNTAVGATSLCDSWVGRLRVWRRGMNVVRGTYVIVGNELYRCDLPLGKAAPTLQLPNEAPLGTALQDGCSWLSAGSATALPGIVASFKHPLFDPNGLLANALTNLLSIPRVSERWIFISIGQGDKTVSSSSDQYYSALRIATDYFLQANVKVFIGFTCYGTSIGLDAWYQAELLPGLRRALTHYADHPSVAKGANLREELGILPVIESDTTTGLTTDGLHLNNAGYRKAGDAWVRSILTTSWL